MEKMWSYSQHVRLEEELSAKSELPSCYVNPYSIDAWHHKRMLESLFPIIQEYRSAKWLTVGDGSFGSDAYFLQSRSIDVMATSISSHTLEVAHERGFLKKVAAQNAEHFTLPDNAVDVVLCKEAYHHFPRPPLGFYEMLRIARSAVVLIEPIDGPKRPLACLKVLAKRLLRRKDIYDQFEPAGNFVYRLNIEETAKMLTALGHRVVAWRKLNTFWHKPFGACAAGGFSWAWLFTRGAIFAQDALCWFGLLNHGLATVIIFKEDPSKSFRLQLKATGFTVIDLLVNPYQNNRDEHS